MAKAKKNDSTELQAALDEIAELKREKAALLQTQVDAEPDDALTYLKKQNADLLQTVSAVLAKQGNASQSLVLKSRAPQPAAADYVLTDERKNQIEAIAAKFEGKGLEYAFEKVGVTFRKKIKVRVYDQDTEQWVREDAYKSEYVHCSSPDATINKIIKFLLLV